MIYHFSELLWLFLLYSFLGWILETVFAAIRQKRFVNRGLVNLPFCILYGLAAIFITIFATDLDGIWLYTGSVILATVFEWTAGHFLEKIYQEKWWDYSHLRFNLDGYICLSASAIWGTLAYVMKKWGNTFFLSLFHLIPQSLGYCILLVCTIALALDILATLLLLTDVSKNANRWISVDNHFSGITAKIAQKIYNRIDKRIRLAYPNAQKATVSEISATSFASGCSFHKIVWLFLIGAFLGDITETIYCRITAGIWMSRSSVVWGPFSIVWGLAIAAATLLLHHYRDRSDTFLFLAGTFLGGAYEYVCSVFTELVFGKVFWDYSWIPFNLGGRINLLYCFFWGIAAVVWIKYLYPKISALIERIPIKIGKKLTYAMLIFMCCNIIVSSMALIRSTERANNIPATATWQQIMDERFDDARLSRIYPNAIQTN